MLARALDVVAGVLLAGERVELAAHARRPRRRGRARRGRRSVPLKNMCSAKCAMPLVSAVLVARAGGEHDHDDVDWASACARGQQAQAIGERRVSNMPAPYHPPPRAHPGLPLRDRLRRPPHDAARLRRPHDPLQGRRPSRPRPQRRQADQLHAGPDRRERGGRRHPHAPSRVGETLTIVVEAVLTDVRPAAHRRRARSSAKGRSASCTRYLERGAARDRGGPERGRARAAAPTSAPSTSGAATPAAA